MVFNLNMCRICSKNDGVIPLFCNGLAQITATMINSLFNIEVIYDVNVPSEICTNCMDNINISVRTKEDIRKSEIMLNKYLEQNSTTVENQTMCGQLSDEESLDSSKLIGLNVEQLFIDQIDNSQKSIAVTTKFSFPEMYDCEKCQFKTDSYKRLIYHMRIHADFKLYECERCGREFKRKRRYKMHALCHQNNKPYKCNLCSKQFKSLSYLKQHNLTHKTERILPCPNCDKTFCHLKGLRAHLLTHNKKNILCDLCGKKFKHSTFLKTHIALIHNHKYARSMTKVPCDLCGKLIYVQSLKSHINNVHFKIKPHSCSYCDKTYPSAHSLTIHMQHHINSNCISLNPREKEAYLKYKCDKCDKLFVSLYYFNQHKVFHSNDKQYSCLHCEKKFAFNYYLDRHVRLVHDKTNPRNSVCTVCGKVSADSSGLKSHMVAHTGETPFHCTFCDLKFRHRKSLVIHTRNKHPQKVTGAQKTSIK